MNISMNPNGELYQSAVNAPGTIEIPESFLNEARQFRELNMRYTCAIREVKTKLEVLNDDLAIRNQRNPIQMIKSRVKKPESIIEKLHRRGFPISVKSVRENLYDVAGIRVICSFVDDIYTVAEMLARQDDINVLMVKDYIRCPKVNGYPQLPYDHRSSGILFRPERKYAQWRSRSGPSRWISGLVWTTR